MGGLGGSVQGLGGGQFRAGGSPADVPQEAVPVEPTPQSPSQSAIYVSTRDELVNALHGTYTTIYVADDAFINLSAMNGPLPLRAGVTLMSGRAGTRGGAVLYTSRFDTRFMFDVMGNNVKVRGLRLMGPSGSYERALTGMAAIRVRVNRARHVEITDNEFWNWTYAGVAVRGNYSSPDEFRRMRREDAREVYIARNYMHHNVRDGLGYGVVVSDGAYATIEGNVFDYNRHAIASDGSPYTGYVARFNYVLSGGHCQEGQYLGCFYNQHFDVHGTGEDGYGGVGGEYFDIAYNTFRGEQRYYWTQTRPAFMLRGRPTIGAYFYSNVAVHDDSSAAVSLKLGSDAVLRTPVKLFVERNTFDTDRSRELAVGDFDADGRQDVFLATGASWYYSSSGLTEWRFLSPTPARLGTLRFGQFDNHPETDVFTQIGTRWFYSSGGRQPWAPLAAIGYVPLSSYHFGDFNGDGRTDVMRTDGTYWYVSWSGRSDWEILKRSAYEDVRLGDFNGDGTTDVFSLAGGRWSFAPSGSGPWERLNDPLTTELDTLIFADFDGNGRTDIAQRSGDDWRYARNGRGGWTPLRRSTGGTEFLELRQLLVADFDGQGGAEALTYGFDNRFAAWSRSTGDAFFARSRANMR
jgi:hypothetical protein